MDCREINQELSAYLDGEVNDKRVRQIESHLASCSECTAELRTLRAAAHFVDANLRELELRPALWQNVHAAISGLPAPSRPEGLLQFIFGRRWLMIPATLAMALVLTIGTRVYLRHQESEKQVAQFMSDYIKARQEEERIRARTTAAQENAPVALYGNHKSADNPFTVVDYSPDDNPFRSEDQ